MVPYFSCCLCLYFGSAIVLVTRFVGFGWLNYHLFGKELFILFAAGAFRVLPSIFVFGCFPFGFEGRIWDPIYIRRKPFANLSISNLSAKCLEMYLI